MFWSGNFIVVRELNFLLKEENVSLAQVLEADDILQECQADNKALIQFLTRPEILSELVTLITEEPRGDIELTQQYRHANAACEVLTSQLSALADRLSLDTTLMHRLCDFLCRPPPLNPLLASYFSKTIEMLLERNPKQDWYLYHIVCLRVLDFLKCRRDFLPNLLRHLSTSAIADTFKCFVRLDDLFNKILMEWLEEHQVLENLIAVVCGCYTPEPLTPPVVGASGGGQNEETTASEKVDTNTNHCDQGDDTKESGAHSVSEDTTGAGGCAGAGASAGEGVAAVREEGMLVLDRLSSVSMSNAAALLCDLVLNGCAADGGNGSRGRSGWMLVSRLQSEALVNQLLQSMFTAPSHRRPAAIAHGATVLLALLTHQPILGGSPESSRGGVERAVAPHLPLLHQSLLQAPAVPSYLPSCPAEGDVTPLSPAGRARVGVGWSRVRVAALLAQLARCEGEGVPDTMLTLGTPGVVLDLFFRHPDNSFLHMECYAMVKHALANRPYRLQYAHHLLIECNLLTRLMDVYEENENRRGTGIPRSGYMGHVILLLRRIAREMALTDGEPAAPVEGAPPPAPDAAPADPVTAAAPVDPAAGSLLSRLPLPAEVSQRWAAFVEDKLSLVAQQHDTPLGGYYPSENIYEFNDMGNAGVEDTPDDDIYCDDSNEMLSGNHSDHNEDMSDVGEDKVQHLNFLEMAQQKFSDVMWEDGPTVDDDEDGEGEGTRQQGTLVSETRGCSPGVHAVLSGLPPWESNQPTSDSGGGEGWAHFGDFGSDPFGTTAPNAPTDPFAAADADASDTDFTPFVSADTFSSASPPPPPPSPAHTRPSLSLAPSDDNGVSQDQFGTHWTTVRETDADADGDAIHSLQVELCNLHVQVQPSKSASAAMNDANRGQLESIDEAEVIDPVADIVTPNQPETEAQSERDGDTASIDTTGTEDS